LRHRAFLDCGATKCFKFQLRTPQVHY